MAKKSKKSKKKQEEEREPLPWRKLCKLIAYIAIFVAICIAWAMLMSGSNFPIREVDVGRNTEYMNQQKIENLVKPYVATSFFSVDVRKIKRVLMSQPWVEKVTVQRIWPDKISIRLREKHPVAYWNNASLLTADGQIFTPRMNGMDINIPLFTAQDEDQELVLTNYNKMNKILKPLKLDIVALNHSKVGSWEISLSNGTKIMLGQQDILTRLRRFVTVYDKVIANHKGKAGYVDLRYNSGVAVDWEK